MLARLLGLLVVVPLMLLCAQSPCGLRVRALAGAACLFFAFETYCILYRSSVTVLGVSENYVRFFALSFCCPLVVWCAHQLLNCGRVTVARAILIVCAVAFALYEYCMLSNNLARGRK